MKMGMKGMGKAKAQMTAKTAGSSSKVGKGAKAFGKKVASPAK